MNDSLPDVWTPRSLTDFYHSRRVAPRTNRIMFEFALPLPQTGRPGEPQHPGTPCMVWNGPTTGTNPDYGRAWWGERRGYFQVQVISYVLANGEVPAGHDVAHFCERHLCGHPGHTRALTRAEHSREHTSRRYPDEFLALAPVVTCMICGGPTHPSVSRRKGQRHAWALTCHPCSAAWHRARRARTEPRPPRGATQVSMSDSDLLAFAALNLGMASWV